MSFNNLALAFPGEIPHYSISDLRRRGWTRRLIDRFLGEPIGIMPNPHVRRGRPMKLFDAELVRVVESEPVFCEESASARQHGALVVEAARAKAVALQRVVDDIEIALPCWSHEQLRQEAIQTFGCAPDAEWAQRHDLSVLMREASACEWALDDYFWHSGIRQARTVLRRKMLRAAIEKFPHLGDVALEWAKKEKGNAEIDVVLG